MGCTRTVHFTRRALGSSTTNAAVLCPSTSHACGSTLGLSNGITAVHYAYHNGIRIARGLTLGQNFRLEAEPLALTQLPCSYYEPLHCR